MTATSPNSATKAAAKINSEEESVLVSFEVATAIDKQTFVDPELQHQVVVEIYNKVLAKNDKIASDGRDAYLPVHLRSGCKQLAQYANRIDEISSNFALRPAPQQEQDQHH